MFQYVEVTKPSEYGPENSELLSLPALHFPPSVVLDELGFGKNRSYHSVESLVQNAKTAFKGYTNGIGPCEGFDNDFFEPYKVGNSRVTYYHFVATSSPDCIGFDEQQQKSPEDFDLQTALDRLYSDRRASIHEDADSLIEEIQSLHTRDDAERFLRAEIGFWFIETHTIRTVEGLSDGEVVESAVRSRALSNAFKEFCSKEKDILWLQQMIGSYFIRSNEEANEAIRKLSPNLSGAIDNPDRQKTLQSNLLNTVKETEENLESRGSMNPRRWGHASSSSSK